MILGRANKHLAPFSKKILLANKIIKNFPEKYIKKTHEVGPILSKNIINCSKSKTENNAKKRVFSILAGKTVNLISLSFKGLRVYLT